MTAPTPKLISEEVFEELNAQLIASKRWMDADDPLVVGWSDRLQKSRFANPGLALLGIGMLHELQGDAVSAEAFFEKAFAKGADPGTVLNAKVSTLSNLGFASMALPLFDALSNVFGAALPYGPALASGVGGFKLAGRMLEMAENAKQDLGGAYQVDAIRRLAEGLAGSTVPDSDFGRVLDIAGELLRARRLFWMGRTPQVDFDEFTGWAAVRYEVDVTPEEASEMNRELDDLVIERGLHTIPITAGFVGTRTDDWLANLRAEAVQ